MLISPTKRLSVLTIMVTSDSWLTFVKGQRRSHGLASARDFAASSAGWQIIDRHPAHHLATADRAPARHRHKLHGRIARTPGRLFAGPAPDHGSPGAPHSADPKKLEIRVRALRPSRQSLVHQSD